ncbi:MAG: peptidase [Rhizobacter sp.]|nr:peptidase [Rhizobacter sp.]
MITALLASLHAHTAQAAPSALPSDVDAALARAKVPRDAISVVVQEAGTGASRIAWQGGRAVNPASVFKLVTTYAALEKLGAAYTWTTPLWLQGPVVNAGPDGVLDGNLVIKGSGDPTLVLERLWLMLRRVRQLGVHEIRGDIVIDRSAFAVPDASPADFDNEPLRPYNVGADALMLNQKSMLLRFTPNVGARTARIAADLPLAGVAVDAEVPLSTNACGDWRAALAPDFSDPLRLRFSGSYPVACGEKIWPLAYADPRRFNARALEAMWREQGGTLGGQVREGIAPANLQPSIEITSPPLAEVIRDINKYSNNTMAQQVFLTMALADRGVGSPEAAREVMRQWLTERFGDVANPVVIDNGSGLSRDSRVTADFLARLLQTAWNGPLMPELLASLPLSGLDGTLRRSRAPLAMAHLKTGSLRDVQAIAGVVQGESGRRYVLVAIVNHPNAGASAPALDALVKWVSGDGARP